MISLKHLEQVFLALQVAGVRAPDVYADEMAKAMGLRMYQAAFDGRTREELEAAVRSYVAKGSPFWPTPGQLLELVPRNVADKPAALAARGECLFGDVVRARSSCGRDDTQAVRYLTHAGIVDPVEIDACLAEVETTALGSRSTSSRP